MSQDEEQQRWKTALPGAGGGVGMTRTGPSNHFRPRFAMSRNLQHNQFGVIYERDPQRVTMHHGHFTGAAAGIYGPED